MDNRGPKMDPSSMLIKEMLDRVGAIPSNIPCDGMHLPTCGRNSKKRSKKFVPGHGGRYPLGYNPGSARRPYSSMDNQHYPNYMYNVVNGDESHAPVPGNYDNPVVVKAAERSIPFFESIDSVILSFNAISSLLESTVTTMQITYETILDAADNYIAIKKFMTKIYSFITSFKLIRWFFTKIYNLLKLVRGNRELCAGEKSLASVASTVETDNNRGAKKINWPIAIFAGAVFAIPIMSYKLLGLMGPVANERPEVKTERKTTNQNVNNCQPPNTRHPCIPPVAEPRQCRATQLPTTDDNGSNKIADQGGNSGPPPKNVLTSRNLKTENKPTDSLLIDRVLPLGPPTLPPKDNKNTPK